MPIRDLDQVLRPREGLRIVAETAGGRRHQIETCLVSRVPEDADEDETVEESHE